MIRTIAEKNDRPFEWIDISGQDAEEIRELAKQYKLHESSVEDLLQPDHLPKFEKFKDYLFVILRVYAVERESQADTVQELTNKLAIFLSPTFIITVHKYDWSPLETIIENLKTNNDCHDPYPLFHEIISHGLHTFDEPGLKLNRTIDYFEERVFLKEKKVPLLKSLYFLKRKVDVIRHVLLLSHDIIDHIDTPGNSNEFTRDIRDLYIKQQSIFDSLAENTNHLLGIYFSISSQRTNETIRVLTIFSVFFMPLTFIVGVYGMNFQFMPELSKRWGYPGVMIFMLLVVVIIYFWFRAKKWL